MKKLPIEVVIPGSTPGSNETPTHTIYAQLELMQGYFSAGYTPKIQECFELRKLLDQLLQPKLAGVRINPRNLTLLNNFYLIQELAEKIQGHLNKYKNDYFEDKHNHQEQRQIHYTLTRIMEIWTQ